MSVPLRRRLAVFLLSAGLSAVAAAAGADDGRSSFDPSLPKLDFPKSDRGRYAASGPAEEGAEPPPLAKAQDYRTKALESADIRLSALAVQVDNGDDLAAYGPETTDAVASWLNVRPAKPKDDAYLAVLREAIRTVRKNIVAAPVFVVPPQSDEFCAKADKAGGNPGYAYHLDGTVYVCPLWHGKTFPCQRVVLIHETFHVAGLVDVDTNVKFPARTTEQALKDAAYMAGLVSQLHSQHNDSCP